MNTNDTVSVVHYNNPERLYLLAEDNNEVYVDNFLMEQHQIDGLRFLFAQFNKKSPGVIVNFPPSCGKSATVAIFLNAVTNILKNPVLILCKDDSEVQYWKKILLNWSSYAENDIAVESLNPFIKRKKVFVKKRENLYSYQRRHWSIIIIKENVVSKEIFKLVFEADFKICITATDIKKDVPLLTAVYKWLYPKRKVNINDFVAKENRPREKFRKSVQLDLILEDVAIRRYLNLKPFQITENADNITEIETNVTEVEANRRKGSLKNKDATGTKVKRTKKTKDDINLITTVNNDVVNDLSGQAFIFINDHKILDQNVNSNSIIINDQLVNPSDQNIILMKDNTINKIDQNYTLVNDVVNETSNQNFILINDGQMLNQVSNQNLILMNELSMDQAVTETSKQNVILLNENKASKNCDNNFVLIDDDVDDKLINNHIKETEDVNRISDADLPLLNENDDFVKDNTNDFSINCYNNNRDKVNVDKSPIHKVINNLDICDENDSFKLDVENFIRDEQPVNRSNSNNTFCNKAESKIKSKFSESLVIGDDSKVDLNEMKYLDNKDLLKEQLIESLHLDEYSANLKEIKELEENAIKEESTEAESSNIESNSKLDLNEIKDLRSQLIESLGFDSDCKVTRLEIKHTENKNNSKVDPNDMKDIRNKCLLQKQLIESLGFSSDCQKSVSENKTTKLNECKDVEEIKEESTVSLSLVSNSKVDQNKLIRDLETKLIKEESIESLNFCSNSKVHQNKLISDLKTKLIKEKSIESLNFCSNSEVGRNETKDLHNKGLLQQQLIESLNLDDVKDEIKNEESDDSDDKMNNTANYKSLMKSQIAADKDDKVIVIKEEPEDGNVTITEGNVNNITKRKSDVSDKDLDDKILEMEERALKKFKGSFLDRIF